MQCIAIPHKTAVKSFQVFKVGFLDVCSDVVHVQLSSREMYTTSSVFLKVLSEAGITHAFVNWGSDHPGLLEDLERQYTENQATRGGSGTNLAIITCPNEMVALSAAQGYAQVTGNPAAVIVHVDVGTQVNHFSQVDDDLFIMMLGYGGSHSQCRSKSNASTYLCGCLSFQQRKGTQRHAK